MIVIINKIFSGLGVHDRKAELRGIEGPPGMEPAASLDIPIANYDVF